MFRKLFNKVGMSLTETILAIGILSIVMAATTAGITAARNNYEKIVLRTDSLTLLSTISMGMEADLSNAINPVVTEVRAVYNGEEHISEELKFESKLRGYAMFYGNVDGKICILAHDYRDNFDVIPLATDSAHTSRLESRLASIEYFPDHKYFEYVIEIVEKETGNVVLSEKFDTRTYE